MANAKPVHQVAKPTAKAKVGPDVDALAAAGAGLNPLPDAPAPVTASFDVPEGTDPAVAALLAQVAALTARLDAQPATHGAQPVLPRKDVTTTLADGVTIKLDH